MNHPFDTEREAADAPRILAGIVGLAVVLRIASALLQGDAVAPLPGIYDQVSYHALALRLLAGHGYTFATQWWPATEANQPTAQWSFLYPLYLAGTYAVFGVHPLAARVIQAVVVGILQPILTYRIGRRLFGTNVGLLGGGFVAVYAYFIYYAGALMTETFYILAILYAFDLTLSLARPAEASSKGFRRWVLLGLAIGIAALLRQLILLFVPLVFLWLLLVKRNEVIRLSPVASTWWAFRQLLPRFVVVTLTLVVLIAPWTVRNYSAFHQFVLLNTNDGYVFFWANNPIYGTSFVPILSNDTYTEMIPANLRSLNEAALNDALLKRGIEFVTANPGQFALLSLSRVKFYFEFWPSADSDRLSNIARVLSFGISLPLMLTGLYLAFRRWRYVSSEQRWGLALIVLFMIGYSLIHILTWTLIRYRLPVDALLIIFAARALDTPISRLVAAHRSREPSATTSLARHSSHVDVTKAEASGHASAWKTLNVVDR